MSFSVFSDKNNFFCLSWFVVRNLFKFAPYMGNKFLFTPPHESFCYFWLITKLVIKIYASEASKKNVCFNNLHGRPPGLLSWPNKQNGVQPRKCLLGGKGVVRIWVGGGGRSADWARSWRMDGDWGGSLFPSPEWGFGGITPDNFFYYSPNSEHFS